MSLRLLLKRTDRPSMGQGDIGFEDELHYKCVVWLYGRTTLPSTVRTLCKAITMLPDTVHGSVNLRDWSVVARYVRSFINGGVISANIQNSTLPSILEVLSQLVQKSTSPPTEQDLRLVCSELISILPENLYNSSGKQILGILGNANRTPVAFRQMVIDLHGAIGDLSDGQPNSNHSPIIDHFLLLLGRAWEGREFDLIIQIVDLLDKSVRSGLQALELDEEEKIHIFLALLEDDQFDRTITSSVRESLLSVSSLLIRGVIQHRVEGMNSTRSSRSTAGLHRTLSTLEKLLADHGMDKDDWEVNLLTLFPWLVGRDIDACAHIIKVLAILVPTPPSLSLDLKDFKSFLEATSPMKPSIDWLPASMVVLLWISRWDASAAWSCLKAWVIPELPLEDYFLAKVRKRERHTERLTRLQFTGKWLRLQPIDIHKTIQVLEELVECASNDVYLKVMKDLLSCVTDLWYDRLVEEGHLRIMCRIMRGVEDERSCHWIACFFFIAIWRWKWTEATKIGKRADFGPFLDEEVVSSVIHFLTSSRNEITRWNFEHFGLNFDDVITVEEAISCCSTYLQIAATTGSISKKMIPSLLDGYKGWVMSILELSSELGKKVDSSLWRDAHDTAGTLFIPLNKTLTHLEGCPQATAVEPSLDSQQHLIDTSVPLVIRSSRSDLILEYPRSSDDNTMGRPVKSQQYQGTENQQWMFIPATPGAYLIQNMGTGGYLTYSKKLPQAPRRFSDGTQFVTERGIAPTLGVEVLCDIIPSEWMVVPNGQKNEMKLLLRDFPTFALDLKGFSKQSGTTYILWTDHKDPRKWNQSFQLERVNT
ncbi:hypothetical protein FRC02_002291 [Tulasnella sp. 418]|nr:hypothetical protein FRC02_002291 [Tulasnella sp. 418]